MGQTYGSGRRSSQNRFYCFERRIIKLHFIDTIFSTANFTAICDQLANEDADLKKVLDEFGYPPMWTRPNCFETMVHIILEQQVSLASAKATLEKLRLRITDITPDNLLTLSDEELKACYFSRQKTLYVRNLAEAIAQGTLDLQSLESAGNDDVRAKLVALKGIGNWTVDVYLMFTLQRADIFPIGDLAAVKAMQKVKQLSPDLSREELADIALQWSPYRTIATMILWHYYLSAPSRKKAKG